MNNPIEDLAKYRKFLENIALDKYSGARSTQRNFTACLNIQTLLGK